MSTRVFDFFHKNYLFILIFLFLLLRLPSLFEPYWYGDEGIYLTLGEGIRHGYTLYTQLHDNKPPTLYYLAALGQTVFGFRLLLALCMVPAIFYFYKLSKLLLSQNLARLATLLFLILTSIPLLEGNIANAEIFMILPTVAAFYLFYKSSNYFSALIAAFLLGVAFTLKVPVLFEFIFLCFWFFLIRFNFSVKYFRYHFFLDLLKIFPLVISFCLPILFWTAYFAYKHALPQFLFSALLQNFGYLSSWSTGTHSGSATSGGLLTRLSLLLVFYTIAFFLYYKKVIDKKITFILLWFAAAIFGALLSTRPYPHYLVQVLPSFCLIIGYLFCPRLSHFYRSLSVGSVIFLAFVILHYKFYFYRTVPYYYNFYWYLSHPKYYATYLNYFGSHVTTTYQIADYIKSNTTPQDRIFIWGDEPYIYPLANRLPVGRYTVAYHIVDFNGYDETIDQLKIQRPRYIIYYPMDNRPFPQLDHLLARYYHLTQVIGSTKILELN